MKRISIHTNGKLWQHKLNLLVKHMNLYVFFVVIRPLERSIAETALVRIAEDVRFDVCGQVCAGRKTLITNTALEALLLRPYVSVFLTYVFRVLVLVDKCSIAVRTEQRLVVGMDAQVLG